MDPGSQKGAEKKRRWPDFGEAVEQLLAGQDARHLQLEWEPSEGAWDDPASAGEAGTSTDPTLGDVHVADPKAAMPLPPSVEEILRSDAFSAPQRTYPSGFDKLDELIDGGIKARQLTVIAAPTGAGKTGFVLQLARHLAATVPVMVASTELDAAEVAARVAAGVLGIKPGTILSLEISPDDAASAVVGMPIRVLDVDLLRASDPRTNVLVHLRTAALALREATGQAPVLVLDYLQMVAGGEDPGDRRVSVGAVAYQLRRLAAELDTAVISVSSVSRAFYGTNRKQLDKENDPRSYLAAAKESGDVEYACAVFGFLDVGEADAQGEARARMVIAKSRRGRVGFVGLKFHGPSGRWFADDGALAGMGAGAKDDADERRVLQILRGTHRELVKSEVRKLVPGMAATRVDAVVDRLLVVGHLRQETVMRPNDSGRMRPRQILLVVDGN